MKDSYWMPEELFIGAVLQFPLYFIIGWWVLPVMLVCGLLWRLGGWSKGHKAFRWLGVPLVVCLSAFLCGTNWLIFIAVPFMVKLSPFSYGESGWLFRWLKNDFLVRIITYSWYWMVFSIAYVVS